MISKLNVQNYKCLTNEQIDMNYLTIFAGGNAVGKSTAIQSILLLKKAFESGQNGEILTNKFFGLNLGLPKDIISKERTSEEICIKIEYGDNKTDEVIFYLEDEITSPLSLKIKNMEDIIIKLVNRDFIFNNGFTYLNTERLGPRIAYDLSSDTILDVGSQGEFTNHVIYKADLLTVNVHQDLIASRSSRFIALCEAWLDIIIPGTQLSIGIFEEINKATIKFKSADLSSDFYLPPSTGFGISYVLPIIVAGLLLSTKENSILVVENPEAHLHPYGQSQIGRFLALIASCGVQVVVETHSEHFVNGARLELATRRQADKMIVNFFTNENKITEIQKINISTLGELDKWPKGFFDQNKIDLRKLLELRLCQN